MVMHARKTQRIGDGYFEKHQTHPYQNSKYSSKGNYERERMRERDSPNGNSYRSDSPECDSPRDRGSSYHSKSLYVSKTRDKERENRDYKRDKYSDCVNRSPKEKRLREARETEHRTNHDRNSSEKNESHALKVTQNSSRETSQRKLNTTCQQQDKREERDRVVRCGDWSEHLSSSGKKYYYNCKTEVSQWEKPREWMEPRPPPPQPQRHPYPSPLQQNRTVTVLDKHSVNSRKAGAVGNVGGRPDKLPPTTSSSSYWPGVQHHDSLTTSKPTAEIPNNSGSVDGQTTDMEICSGDSTPTSETSGGQQEGANAPGPPQQPLHVETIGLSVDPGPPTPTHSETQDCTDARKLTTSPPSSLLSSGTALAGLRPQAPNLTPSLVNHYRDDLVNHVRGWPADLLEKQAQKLSEEAHNLGSLCTRVSAELKCARSVVRLTEIQATLQEQRVLFLRQQIKNLEELKSQNSFMADEP